MNARDVLAILEKLGKPQTAAIYKRYGAGENVLGVLTSEIVKIRKKIRVDHALAMELWETGNAEARVLALEVADPVKLTRAEADRLVHDGPVREKEIHRSPNWVRYTMNSALISIGVFKPALREKAMEAARRIGKVEVDHGETYCKTPDAVSLLAKAKRRRR